MYHQLIKKDRLNLMKKDVRKIRMEVVHGEISFLQLKISTIFKNEIHAKASKTYMPRTELMYLI